MSMRFRYHLGAIPPPLETFLYRSKNEFSPDFCRMIDMLVEVDSDLDGNVKAL